ncbi:hypothetical protein J6590_025676 [Homalodisca vitripennis]|nr:hypothetical protein J6590_025676 [Homalodisca vitripennis]
MTMPVIVSTPEPDETPPAPAVDAAAATAAPMDLWEIVNHLLKSYHKKQLIRRQMARLGCLAPEGGLGATLREAN